MDPPATEPRVVSTTAIHPVAGSLRAALTTSTSLISGRVRNEESTKATANRPGGPSSGIRTPWIQERTRYIP